MIINNIEFVEPNYECPRCGNTKLNYKYVESNKSIQARCSGCSDWYGNIKYDSRTHDEIRKARINEWKENRQKAVKTGRVEKRKNQTVVRDS